MRCKDCKYFGVEICESGFHTCEIIKHGFDEGDMNYGSKKAHVVDGSGYFAALRIKEDFGCVEFINKGDSFSKRSARYATMIGDS